MDDFSPGFFIPKRPSFQSSSYVNLNPNNPEYGVSRNHSSASVPSGRWNYQFDERRRPPQPQPPPPFRYYSSDFQNGGSPCYNHGFQQANGHFPPLGYCPPQNIHQERGGQNTPKSARSYVRESSPPVQISGEFNGCSEPNKLNGVDNDHNVNFHYEYPPLSAGGVVSIPRRKKNSPTQVPIQAIHRSNGSVNPACSNSPVPWTRANKRESSPPAQDRGSDESGNSSARSFEQVPMNSNDVAIREIMMAMTNSFKNHVNGGDMQEPCNMPNHWDNGRNEFISAGLKYFENARRGLNQFQQDFGTHERGPEPNEMAREEPEKWIAANPVYFREQNEASMFEVDEKLLVDKRPVINLVGPGEREFRLFDDLKSGSDIIRTVYDVNNMDIFNPREICSRRLLPKSVVHWPVDLVLGNEKNLNSIKRTMLRIKGQTSVSSNEQTISSIFDMSDENKEEPYDCDEQYSDISDIKLKSLVRFINGERVLDNPMGFITFMGYNVHKLYKDLDKNGFITPSFAGPLADRNYSFDASQIEVMKPLGEYVMPQQAADGDFEAADKWRRELRFKRTRLCSLSLDTLFYVFYTFCGDAMQVLAAGELYRRGWRFHRVLQVWLTPVERDDTPDDGDPWKSGAYRYFNFQRWEYVRDTFKVNECMLEGKPQEFSDALWN